jgi:hypothetical protein
MFGAIVMEFDHNCGKERTDADKRECLEQNIDVYSDRPDVVDAIDQIFVLRNRAMGRDAHIKTNKETRMLFLIELMCNSDKDSVSYTLYPDKESRVEGEDAKIQKELDAALKKKCGSLQTRLFETGDEVPVKTFAVRPVSKTSTGYATAMNMRHFPEKEYVPLTKSELKRNAERTASLLHKKSKPYRDATTKRVRDKIKVLSKAAASHAIDKAVRIQRAIRTFEKKMDDKPRADVVNFAPSEPGESPPIVHMDEDDTDDAAAKRTRSTGSKSRRHSHGDKNKKPRRGGKATKKRRG